jgi:1,4-alpha-glucan branching enzyme
LLERNPIPHEERISLELYAPEAQAVFVAGTFNNWQLSTMPLQRQFCDRWVAELKLGPGMYEYRFIVDGEWRNDPWSRAYVANAFGGLNCILLVAIRE